MFECSVIRDNGLQSIRPPPQNGIQTNLFRLDLNFGTVFSIAAYNDFTHLSDVHVHLLVLKLYHYARVHTRTRARTHTHTHTHIHTAYMYMQGISTF